MAHHEARTFHNTDSPYYLPNDDEERRRLDDMQKVMKKVVFDGKNILAPLDFQPTAILDCGCGVSGAWAIEVAKEFPEAKVAGIDLSPLRKDVSVPVNCQFLTGDMLKVLINTFKEGQFDLIQSRLVLWGMPPTNWDKYIADVFFLTQPAGWVQFIEFHWDINSVPSGTAAHKFMTISQQSHSRRGMLSGGAHIPSRLAKAGFINIHVTKTTLKHGGWTSPPVSDEEKERRRVVNYAFWTLVCLVVETKEEFKREFPDNRERTEFGKAAQEELLSGRYPLENTIWCVVGQKPINPELGK